MSKVKNYLSLIRFSHTIFAMPFALIGFALGVLKNAALRYPNDVETGSGFLGTGLSAATVALKFTLVLVCMISGQAF